MRLLEVVSSELSQTISCTLAVVFLTQILQFYILVRRGSRNVLLAAGVFLTFWTYLFLFTRVNDVVGDLTFAMLYFISFMKALELAFCRRGDEQLIKMSVKDFFISMWFVKTSDVGETESSHPTAERFGNLRMIFFGVLRFLLSGFLVEILLPYQFDRFESGLAEYWMVHVGYGVALVALLEGSYAVIAGAVRLFMNEDVVHGWKNPYLASGPRDFWSRRWNRPIRLMLHRTVFLPTRSFLSRLSAPSTPTPPPTQTITFARASTGQTVLLEHLGPVESDYFSEHASRRPPSVQHIRRHDSDGVKASSRGGRAGWVEGCSAMASFVVSGVMHELIMWHGFQDRYSFHGDQLAFFTLHGIITTATLYLSRAFPRLSSSVPHFARVILWNIVVVVTSPLFFNLPVQRAGALHHLVLPPACSWSGICKS